MVRILVGTLLEVGRGHLRPPRIWRTFWPPRTDAGRGETKPACGLCLEEVRY